MSKKIIEYTIVNSNIIKEWQSFSEALSIIEDRVNEKIKEGFVPIGGICHSKLGGSNMSVLSQALVKYQD